MRRRSLRSGILIAFIALALGFIFSNSFAGVSVSEAQSRRVLELVAPIIEPFIGEGYVTLKLIRKMAHVVEFGVLGIGLSLLFRRAKCVPLCLLLLAALADETIQVYTGRGSLVLDVWLDIAGGAIGFLSGAGLQYLCACRGTRNSYM